VGGGGGDTVAVIPITWDRLDGLGGQLVLPAPENMAVYVVAEFGRKGEERRLDLIALCTIK
jgi:hypothetical protein